MLLSFEMYNRLPNICTKLLPLADNTKPSICSTSPKIKSAPSPADHIINTHKKQDLVKTLLSDLCLDHFNSTHKQQFGSQN